MTREGIVRFDDEKRGQRRPQRGDRAGTPLDGSTGMSPLKLLSFSVVIALSIASTGCGAGESGGSEDDDDTQALTTGDAAPPVRSVLYGTIRKDGRAAAGVRLRVGCPTLDSALGGDARADETGGYTIAVLSRAYGKCSARISDGAVNGPAFDVGVSPNPVRRDLDLDAALVPKP